MKKLFSKIVGSVIVLSSISYAAPDAVKVSEQGSGSVAAKEDNKQMNAILTLVLQQVIDAKAELSVRLHLEKRTEKGEDKSVMVFDYLNVGGVLKFKDGIEYKLAPESNGNNPIKDVIPSLFFSTQNLVVVAKVDIKEKGTARVRFCQNYKTQTDECDTLEDSKLLDVTLKSKTFREVTKIRLKEIKMTFNKDLGGGIFEFSGSCIAFKTSLDAQMKSGMKEAKCEFGGKFDSAVKTPDFRFTFE